MPETTSSTVDERWRKDPSVADLVFALMSAPGFNDDYRRETSLFEDVEHAWAGRVLPQAQSTLGEPKCCMTRAVKAPSRVAGSVSRWATRTVRGVAAVARVVARHAWEMTPWGERQETAVQGINVIVWGPPGNGKSQLVKAAVKNFGYELRDKDLSRVAPEDLTGIPGRIRRWTLRGKQMFTSKAPDQFFYNLAHTRNVALRLDDLTNSAKLVQAASLGLVLDRVFDDGTGGTYSIRHVPVVATSNFGDAATVSELLAPMANRFVHLFTSPNEDATEYWTNGGRSAFHIDPTLKDSVREQWQDRYGRAWALCSAFVREYRGSAWSKEPEEFTDVKNYAWCSPRTLELAARCIAVAEHFGFDDRRLLEGAIGVQGARKLMDFRRNLSLPTAEDVFAGRVLWSSLKPSGQVILLQKAATECATDEQLSATLAAMEKVQSLARGSDDLTVLAARTLEARARGEVANRPMSGSMKGLLGIRLGQIRKAGMEARAQAETEGVATPEGGSGWTAPTATGGDGDGLAI